MALEDVSFYDIFGDLVSFSTILNEMIESYQEKLEAGETQITDFNEGSEIRNLLEIFSVPIFTVIEEDNELSKLPFISLSYGVWLDRIGENPFINLARIEGSPSKGNVTFTLAFEQDTDFTIPVETLLEDTNGLQYSTDDACTIYAGELSNYVGVTCLSDGYEGNINPGELTIISDDEIDTEIVSVNNEESFMDGTDYEEDEDYRRRLLENVRSEGFGSVPYYVSLAESVDGVHDVLFVEDNTYTRKILVNGYERPTTPDTVLLDVLTTFTDKANIVLDQKFTVASPSVSHRFGLIIEMDVFKEWDDDDLTEFFYKLVYGGSYEQIEFKGLNIGENLTAEMIINGFELIEDVVDITSITDLNGNEFISTDISVTGVIEVYRLRFNQNVING